MPIYKDVIHAVSNSYAAELKSNCKSSSAFSDAIKNAKDPSWLSPEELIAQASFTIKICKKNLNTQLVNYMDAVYTLPNIEREEGEFCGTKRTERKELACLNLSYVLSEDLKLHPTACWFFVREYSGLPRLISRKNAKEIVNKSEASLSRYKRRIFKELANYHDQMLLHLHGPLQDADLIPKTANA